MLIPRNDNSVIGRWWWQIDRVLLGVIMIFFFISFLLSMVATSYVQHKLAIEPFTLVNKHLLFILCSIFIIIFLSLLTFRVLSVVMFFVLVGSFLMMLLVLFYGITIKGSKRWLDFGFFALQPSEFFKPAFIFFVALFFHKNSVKENFVLYVPPLLLFAIYSILLWHQPDIGQIVVIAAVFVAMLFITGISLFYIGAICIAFSLSFIFAYWQFSHIRTRLAMFFENFSFTEVEVEKFGGEQTDFALRSILHGGWFGKGAGEGVYKNFLPDSYSDFIFAIAIEEFGIVFAVAMLVLIVFFGFRILQHVIAEQRWFNKFCLSGLLLLFWGQSLLNLAVNLALLPTKGITLPIFSYGGSSMVSFAILLGIVLNLTKGKKHVKKQSFFYHSDASEKQHTSEKQHN